MAYSSNSSTGSVGTSSVGSSIGTPSSTSTGTSGVSVGTSASTGNGATTSNSNGNFSGGLPGLGGGSWSSPSSETAAAHASGVQGPGLANGNFGSSWSGNGNSGSGSGDYTYNNTSYSNNKSEPTMTVDEVYGKSDTSSGNQSIVESQGDYNATSNEKSNVETSTFGKQDDITVTPESVTENKGIVDNSTIESIEGLNFQQKDKESQDVLEARKSRDDAEAKDKANQMRDSLKAKTDETLDEESAKQFQIGEENTFEEENNAKLNELNQQKQELEAVNAKLAQFEPEAMKEVLDKRDKEANAKLQEAEETKKAVSELVDGIANLTENPVKTFLNKSEINEMKSKIVEDAKKYGLDLDPKGNIQDITKQYTTVVRAKCDKDIEAANKVIATRARAEAIAQEKYKEALSEKQALQAKYNKAQEDYKTWEAEYWVNDTKTKAEEAPVVTPESKAITAENAASDTKQTFDNAIQNAVENGADEQTVQAMTDIATAIDEAQTSMKQAIEQNDIPAYIDAQKQYNKNLNEALQIGNSLTQTDYNKSFVAAVAKANDFTVTLADGTQTTYSQFATDMATKSPEVAKAMYEAKAQKYEAENHPVLAKIERAKASMVETWIGSKLTMADNQVRNQFNQMAKTDMRATYAAYNNVLNDPNASPEAKAEASAAINQANALMTASAALQASTGFFSGIGDSMSDGVYGTTDPTTLNAYQKTLNAIDNYAKITLGLGVTPGANKAYQNMYYMAGAKVNESGLFGRDFDSDGFALCQEYGNNAAAGMITGVGELATGVALFFNPAMAGIGLNLVIDSVQTFTNGLYGVQKDARKSQQYTQEVLNYFKEAESIAAETGNKEIINSMSTTMSNAVKQIENFELKADEVGNLDNWLEGSGSNTATNEKFNQSLTYDEWLKLIEADPTMRDYAKKLISEKKEK